MVMSYRPLLYVSIFALLALAAGAQSSSNAIPANAIPVNAFSAALSINPSSNLFQGSVINVTLTENNGKGPYYMDINVTLPANAGSQESLLFSGNGLNHTMQNSCSQGTSNVSCIMSSNYLKVTGLVLAYAGTYKISGAVADQSTGSRTSTSPLYILVSVPQATHVQPNSSSNQSAGTVLINYQKILYIDSKTGAVYAYKNGSSNLSYAKGTYVSQGLPSYINFGTVQVTPLSVSVNKPFYNSSFQLTDVGKQVNVFFNVPISSYSGPLNITIYYANYSSGLQNSTTTSTTGSQAGSGSMVLLYAIAVIIIVLILAAASWFIYRRRNSI
jgi:hypothetical protein